MRTIYKLTAVTMTGANGRKVQLFLKLPVIGDKTVLPREKFNEISNMLNVRRGDTVSFG